MRFGSTTTSGPPRYGVGAASITKPFFAPDFDREKVKRPEPPKSPYAKDVSDRTQKAKNKVKDTWLGLPSEAKWVAMIFGAFLFVRVVKAVT